MTVQRADAFDISDFLNTTHEYDDFKNFVNSTPMTPNYDESGTSNCIRFKIDKESI